MYKARKKDRIGIGGKSLTLKAKRGNLVEGDRRSITARRLLYEPYLELFDSVDCGLPECLTYPSPDSTGTENS
jgi:hypothetical protein